MVQVMLQRGELKDFQKRMKLYQRWVKVLCIVARPVEHRAGYFKKASNMNYCLRVAKEVTRIATEHQLSGKQARQRLMQNQPEGNAFIAGVDQSVKLSFKIKTYVFGIL